MVKGTTVGTEPSAADTPLEQDFDAVLHLGGPSALSMTRVQKSVCNDPEYLKMRLGRLALTATPTDPDPGPGDIAQLRKLCGLTAAR